MIRKFAIQFARFGVVGAINTIIQLTMTYVLIYLGISYIIAYAIGFIVAVSNSFILNGIFVFKKSAKIQSFVKTLAVYTVTMLLGLGFIFLLVERLNINKSIAPIINIAMMTPLNFILNKLWAFK